MSISDPPYNSRIAGNVTKRRKGVDEFAMASGEMTEEQFSGFLQAFLGMAKAHCEEGALIYSFMDWRGVAPLIMAAKACGLEHINLATWAKHSAGLGSFYRSQTEHCGVFRVPGRVHRNNVMLGKGAGRHRSNLWSYEGRAGFGRGRKEDLERHPTPKPVAMIVDAILDCTARGDVVLDLFGGAGTTAIAAQRTGRKSRSMEISPGYVEASLLRFRACFGEEPIHTDTGLTFAELAQHRRDEAGIVASAAAEKPDATGTARVASTDGALPPPVSMDMSEPRVTKRHGRAEARGRNGAGRP
jgi:DNA modification methylase